MIYDKQMEDLWMNTKVKSNEEEYVLKLRGGAYVLGEDEDNILEVHNRDCAFIFSSIDEAERYTREHWIDAKIEKIS